MPRLSKIGAAALAAFGWTSGSAVTATYLVVAGGGGGGMDWSGGGGAGGLLTGTTSLNPTQSYAITIGAGGAGATSPSVNGSSGTNSVAAFATTVTAIGGGYGGSDSSGSSNGGAGGSGGGGDIDGTGGAGTAGQGFAGGAGSRTTGLPGGGGGGAGGVGANGAPNAAGNGGVGLSSSISGTATFYAGGGGANGSTSYGLGGNGGGGNGAGYPSGPAPQSGTANRGGGGGGSVTTAGTAGAGGSGVVIISYPGAQQFGGGNVTSVGGNTIHTFTTSGTLSPLSSLTAQYLIVAGGGTGGGYVSGGGGAGGLLTGTGVTIDTNSNYVVTVGAGGAGGSSLQGNQGGNSSWSMVPTVAVGGGGGATGGGAAGAASTGGSGGGGAGTTAYLAGAAGTSGQGFAGGSSPGQAVNYPAGGGGGAGAVGVSPATVASNGGNGGIGIASSISGTSTYYAGGGGGGCSGSGSAGTGGSGGGGNGAYFNSGGSYISGGTAGTANTGGGSGGGGSGNLATNGGSGVVIIAYPGSTQQMAGGTVTISGGNVIHTFTSSGYLTPIKYASRSLRTRASASAYLNRTFGSTGNTKTWTWSGWVKRGVLGTKQNLFGQVNISGVNRQCYVSFETDNTLSFVNYTTSGFNYYLRTTQVFRDPSAWYHIVIVSDTSQATAANRLNMYINGVQVTAFGTATYPSQNFDGWINADTGSGVQLGIGRTAPYNTTEYLDGYLTEINFVDGAALTPSSFGTFNSYGVWQPITYGGSYGTNGFYLTFGNNTSTTTLGYDTSPQGNNWTTNNISLTAGATYDSMTDVPTLTSATVANYAVLNPLDKNSDPTISNGNLQIATTGAGNPGSSKATLGISSGKWYWEITQTAGGARGSIGIIASATQLTQFLGSEATGYIYNGIAGNKYNNGTATAYGASYTNGDVIGVALDMDAGTLVFYKNNSSQGTAFTGLTGTFSPAIGDTGGSSGAYAITLAANFGQQPFTYTPPSGFVALNTYNLSTPTIPNGAAYMAATTYAGSGANGRSVTTGFRPDFVWVKNRSSAFDNILGNSLILTSGEPTLLSSNLTDAEFANGYIGNTSQWTSTSFTVNNDSRTNASGSNYVAWAWLGGNTNGSGVSNTNGTITSTVSANTTAGFSVVTYTGTGSAATVGHGLGVAPSMVIVKSRSLVSNWLVWHTSLPTPSTAFMALNLTDASANSSTLWNSTVPTSSVFSLGTNTAVNNSASTYVAYVFAAVAGFSAFGSYTGNGSTDGPFVYTGFRPRFVMVKCSSNSTGSTVWTIWDTSRSPYNASVNQLYANLSAAEDVDSAGIDILSNGFKPKRNSEYANLSGWTYIYMCFAENPFKYSNAR